MSGNWTPVDDEGEEEAWDQAFAEELIGSYVIVGITVLDPSGDVLERSQLHGFVLNADPEKGITIRPEGEDAGDDFNLPPMLDAFEPAEPGIYTNEAGEEVNDPDFVAYWTVTRPQNG